MFGKRSATDTAAPPPAPVAGVEIATRPQRQEAAPVAAPAAPIQIKPTRVKRAEKAAEAAAEGPRSTTGLDQLRAAQGGTTAPAVVTEIVREQSDYYHATKTTIYTALLNTIDLAQLAQLDIKAAAEEIRDIVAELVAIKNVSMSSSEQEHLVQDIINDVLGYGPL